MSEKKEERESLSVGDFIIMPAGAYSSARAVGESIILLTDMNLAVILACGVGLRYSDDIEDCILGTLGQNDLIMCAKECIEDDFDILRRMNKKKKERPVR